MRFIYILNLNKRYSKEGKRRNYERLEWLKKPS